MRISYLVAGAALAALTPAVASATAISGLYNTGVDATGTKLVGDNQSDVHYTVGGASTYTTSNPSYVTDANAAFVASQPNGQGGSQTYTLTFDLGSLNALTAALSGDVAYDNGVVVSLNGNVLYTDVPNSPGTFDAFQNLHHFAATAADFVSGINTLTFAVTDYGQPTGLLVTNLSGTAAVPEASTWAMMVVGFGVAGMAARRRKVVFAA